MRLLAAMSGGVDSSVAAALAASQGHEVVGVTMKQWEFPDEETRLSKGCCTLDAVADARRAAGIIGIPHYTMDFREVFEREVVDPFVADYAAGRTPNPCVRCNRLVRFGALWERARRLGFDGLVTGHYARIDRSADRARLLRARNGAKDQSYVLYALDPGMLERVHLPLGEVTSKDEVRAQAGGLGLPNAGREDSVEVCFVGEGRKPGDVVAERAGEAVRPGAILDADGAVVGRHRGLAYYTVGQRRGLGPLGPRPRYVREIDASTNTLVVDTADALGSRMVSAVDARFFRRPADGARCDAVVRYRAEPVAATYRDHGPGFGLELDAPVRAAAPGQAVVLYDGDEVLGGGTIVAAS